MGGDLYLHGGVVEVFAVPSDDDDGSQQTLTLTDRYARVELTYDPQGTYLYRFKAAQDVPRNPSLDGFATAEMTIGSRRWDGPNGPLDVDYRAVRVPPMAEHSGVSEAARATAAWGTVERYDDPPPANVWGARALTDVFEKRGEKRHVRVICEEEGRVRVCSPDPDDALLMEALWWRAIAEGRLERMRHDALKACYDSGGLFGRPDFCVPVHGRGWPEYAPE